MIKKSIFLVAMCGLMILLPGGCARNISSSQYDARTVGSTASTFPCKVVRARVVNVQEGDYLEDNKLGMTSGAIAGGVLGNMIGKGKGRVLATAAGALAGSVGGAMLEKEMKSQQGMEYVVRLNDGSLKTVVQGLDHRLVPGQNALLMIYSSGRSRLVAM